MTFRYDARAALAALRASAEPCPTPPIVPTPDAEPCPTVGGIGTVAGPWPEIHADLDAFEERAAIAEHDGGLSRAEAERLAAQALGFATPAALSAAAAAGWAARLATLAQGERDPLGRRCIAAAQRFVADGWAEKAAAVGWPELELFGADPDAPWARHDRMGAAYCSFTPCAVTRDAFTYRGTAGAPMRRWRASQADGARLPWERIL